MDNYIAKNTQEYRCEKKPKVLGETLVLIKNQEYWLEGARDAVQAEGPEFELLESREDCIQSVPCI